MFRSCWSNRELIWQLTKREVIGRYRGSVMGLAWSFLHSLLMLLIYTFVFSVVFKARWGIGGDESKADFALILFVGMLIHGLFAECLSRAPGLILANPSYVKRVVFPLEILPWVALGSALFHATIGLLVLMGAFLFLNHGLQWTALLLPAILLPLLLGTMGFGWPLASTGVFVRDNRTDDRHFDDGLAVPLSRILSPLCAAGGVPAISSTEPAQLHDRASARRAHLGENSGLVGKRVSTCLIW